MEIPTQFVNSGSYPARSGNHVRPLVDGTPAFRRICESIESATTSVWATITFMWPSVEMPDGRGAALSVLQQAALRGVDVRLIFWRPEDQMEKHRRNAFWGSAEHFDLLANLYPDINVRWDRAAPGYCQHQKTWLIDVDKPSATSFVGGINLNPNSLVSPGHSHINSHRDREMASRGHSDPQNHDVYIELSGPSVTDVQHNFVQRWNEASERASHSGLFGKAARDDLPFPACVPEQCGKAVVQIQRTTHSGLYQVGHAPLDGHKFDIERGERTILAQYCIAIESAERTIYIENQYLEVMPIVSALHDALSRGVEVLIVLPVTPDFGAGLIELSDDRKKFLALRAGLATHENFMLCGLAAEDENGNRAPVYVHSKLMIVDGNFATVGSCNLHHFSLYGNGELNAAIQDSESALALMADLFHEHIGEDVSDCDDLSAFELFKSIAEQNRERHEQHDSNWQGLAFCLDISTYGASDPFSR